MIDFGLFREVFQSLNKNKLRTLLSGFTVAFAIMLFTILFGIANGFQNTFNNEFNGDANNSIFIYSGRTSKAVEGYQTGRRIQFDNELYNTIKDEFNDDIEFITGRVYKNVTASFGTEKSNYLLSKFELNHLKDVKAKNLSGGEYKKLVISLSLLSDPNILLLDEPFSALDVLTISMLQEIIINLQQETNITICICDHIASSLLQITDSAMILSNGRIVAEGSPRELVNNIDAKSAYFGDSFNF